MPRSSDELNAEIERQLGALVGLPLAAARRAADMRNFQFGVMRTVKGGSVGDFALHIQCPWQIEGPDGIVTGRADLWDPALALEPDSPDFDWDAWEYSTATSRMSGSRSCWATMIPLLALALIPSGCR